MSTSLDFKGANGEEVTIEYPINLEFEIIEINELGVWGDFSDGEGTDFQYYLEMEQFGEITVQRGGKYKVKIIEKGKAEITLIELPDSAEVIDIKIDPDFFSEDFNDKPEGLECG